MEELFGQLVLLILQVFFEVICYFTAKWTLPLVSGGRLQVVDSIPRKNWWSYATFVRRPSGLIEVDSGFASLLGLLFWLAIICGGIILYRALK
jgi:hypothetical protein